MQKQTLEKKLGSNLQPQTDIILILPKNSGLKDSFSKVFTHLKDYHAIKTLQVRGEDIPYWVSLMKMNNKKAIGITGEDLLTEWIHAGNSVDDLQIEKAEWYDPKAIYKKPALCLIGSQSLEAYQGKKILTICICAKYKQTAERYLKTLEDKGFSINRIYINGSLEDTCIEGLADMIIDIVYTGKSMQVANLQIVDTIMTSDIAIIKGV